MNLELPQIICIIVMGIQIISSISQSFKRRNSEEVVNSILRSTASLISLGIVFQFFTKISEEIDLILGKYDFNNPINTVLKIVGILIIYWLIKFIIYLVMKLINGIIFSNIRDTLEKSNIALVLISGVLGFIRGLIILVTMFILIAFVNKLGVIHNNITFFEDIKLYRNVERAISQSKVDSIKSGLVQDISKATVVYYNGVTINEGIKSNEDIKNKAINLTKNCKTDREKAKVLYAWVGSNIKYDDNKANKLTEGNDVKNSGAIPAFNERKGVCFDYACLYAAMCKDINIKGKIITGEAFNGKQYISHAWNEIYLADENKWIKVDPTFYIAGDYFDNKNFDKDHREDRAIKEW